MLRELSVGDVSSRSGVAVSTLHFYERKGLIGSHRSSGNQRRYDRGVLRVLAVIRIGQELGVPLGEIADALKSLPADRPLHKPDWERLSLHWRERLDRRIVLLTRLRDELTGCIGCGCLSLKACPLTNPGDRLGQVGTGPVHLRREGDGKA